MASTSLKSDAGHLRQPTQALPEPTRSGTNYREAVFDNPPVLRAIRSSVIISVGTMLLTLLLAAPAAYALARLRLRGGALIVLLLLISQLLPSIVIAGPLFVVFSRIDLVNSYPALILADATVTLPFAVIILRPFFLAVPMELESAALVDGSTRFGAFWRIVLPLVRPGLITVAAFAFLFTWGEFVFALSLNINEDIQPVTVALNKFIGQYGTQWNLPHGRRDDRRHPDHRRLRRPPALHRRWPDHRGDEGVRRAPQRSVRVLRGRDPYGRCSGDVALAGSGRHALQRSFDHWGAVSSMRIVQVGVGSFGRSWATLVRDAEGSSSPPSSSRSSRRGPGPAMELGLAPADCLATLDEALARDDWEAALVVTPPETHRAVAERILRAGRHVLIEKPLATTLADARALVARRGRDRPHS